ncbi:MAG TPA: TolC family protein, partial [Gemmatimonadales bacterium]
MILLLLALAAGAPAPAGRVAPASAAADTIPRITLGEALRRAAQLDPDYVRALGAVDNAAWARRAAMSAMILPSITVGSDYNSFSINQFNVGTGAPARVSATARIDARFELFSGGRKFATLSQTGSDLEGARAGEQQQRFLTALTTEADYYAVLSNHELVDVSRDRVRRAEEQLVVARARVVSGAAVQTDSLQLLLELNRARVGLLQDEARLRVARLVLGQRVGSPGGVDAEPLDTARAPDLPITLVEAMTQAVEQGPEYRVARANERSAEAFVRARRGSYLPSVFLSANQTTFGDKFYPEGLT